MEEDDLFGNVFIPSIDVDNQPVVVPPNSNSVPTSGYTEAVVSGVDKSKRKRKKKAKKTVKKLVFAMKS